MSLRSTMLAALGAACLVAFGANSARAAEPIPLPDVQVRGAGPVQMVLIPGWGCDWSVWDAFMKRNEAKYTMHAVTLSGFGGTPAPQIDASAGGAPWFDNATGAIAKHMQDKGIRDAVVVGHSLGGLLALRMATEHPELTSKAVTVDGFAAIPFQPGAMTLEDRAAKVDTEIAPEYRSMNDETWASLGGVMIESMVTDPKRADELVALCRKTPREVGVEYMIQLLRSDVSRAVAASDAPLLAIAAMDSATPAEMRAMSQAIWREQFRGPKAQVVFFENTRHFVMDDRPAEFDAAIAAFVEGRPVQGVAAAPTPAPPPEGAPPKEGAPPAEAPKPGGGESAPK